jgi:multicomponent Na+:H+ antiporter subunit B
LKFRNILALIAIVFVGFFLFQTLAITPGKGQLTINKFGNAEIEDRTAQHYINKDVNGSNEKIIYKKTENPESGSANIVTSVVANYRSLDTLGEVTVLFLAATGLGAILYRKEEDRVIAQDNGSLILTSGVKLLFPLLLLLGAYIFIHGHLTPGGGFQGGAVIATAFLLMFLANSTFKLNRSKLKIVEGLAGLTFVGLGLYGLAVEGSFLTNFIDTGLVGTLFSGGIIPVIYIAIGLKVGTELSGIINDLIYA